MLPAESSEKIGNFAELNHSPDRTPLSRAFISIGLLKHSPIVMYSGKANSIRMKPLSFPQILLKDGLHGNKALARVGEICADSAGVFTGLQEEGGSRPTTACVGAQPVLTQTSSVSVSPEQSAQITCSMSDGDVITGYWVNWYQQKHESTPSYLLHYKSNSEKGSATPARFSVSKDTAGNACHLTISSVEVGDYAEYYCEVWHPKSGKHTQRCDLMENW
ncbi:VPRE3 protein, partial [Polyodon spathula]|nr:VPRE3 protein [Polyodon spathula]